MHRLMIPVIQPWDFHGQERSNGAHDSKTDPDALWARKGKGKEAIVKLSEAALVLG